MEPIRKFLSHWPLALLLMLAGSILGLLCWMFIPGAYTASTRLTVGIDYNRTGSLDNLEEDRILGVTEDILHSDPIMEPVFRASLDDDYGKFFRRTMITRTNETWCLEITGKDPEETAHLALLWLDTAYDALDEALDHAIRAEALQNRLEGLTRCLQSGTAADTYALCNMEPDALLEQIGQYTEMIRAEETASHGLSSAIRLGTKNSGQVELVSANRTAAADTLIGAFCGLLIAFGIAWLPGRESDEKEQA